MDCEEKARLVEEYHRAAVNYAQAARALSRTRSTRGVSEYEQLRAAADEARARSMEARLAIAIRQSIAVDRQTIRDEAGESLQDPPH